MRTSFVVAVLLVGLAVAGGTAAGQPGTPLEGDGATFATVDEGNNSSVSNESVGFGSSVSSFLQSTAAETNTAVDQGIWEANVEGNATAEEARNWAVRLGERVAELRAQRAGLAELRSNGSISLPTYVVRDARLRAELRSLGAAANQTQQVAPNDTAVQQSLANVKQAANAASGPPDEVANRTGAPSNVPGAGKENGSAPGETVANASNGNGPPSDVGDTRPNEAGTVSDEPGNGPPSDVGDTRPTEAANGTDGVANGTNGSGTDNSGNAGSDVSDSSNSNNASSAGTGSNSDGVGTGTTGDSSGGSTGGSTGSAGSSADGASGSNESGSGSPPTVPGNPGPKSD